MTTGMGIICSQENIDVCGIDNCCAFMKMKGEPNLTISEYKEAENNGYNYSDGAINYGCFTSQQADELSINFLSLVEVNFKNRLVYDAICIA